MLQKFIFVLKKNIISNSIINQSVESEKNI